MRNRKFNTAAAVIMSAALAFSGTVMAGDEKETAKEQTSLSIAGEEESGAEETVAPEETEEPTETEKPTEAPTEAKVFDQLETTGSTPVQAVDVSDIVESCMPSIVSVTMKSMQEVRDIFGGSQQIEKGGAGSGIIIAQNETELLIATNYHVVQDASELTVCFSADAEDENKLLAKAKVKGAAAGVDLAVIAVNLNDIDEDVFKQLKVATLGSSDKLKVGEAAIVIGNALGSGQTVTTGIVSALGREITTDMGTQPQLQTDAAVNYGCSGGAILNARGEVIAITDAKEVDNDAESMGYGIPIDTAIPILKDLINRETREVVKNHGYMGITVVPVSDEAKELYDMPAGAFVYSVTEGSAAEKAGIKKGDIITKFDGLEVSSSDQLVDTLSYYEAGETLTVELKVANGSNGYDTKEVEVTLQEGEPVEDLEEEEPADPEADVQGDNGNGNGFDWGSDMFSPFWFGGSDGYSGDGMF
ncbi:MAG: trypsin-like peptidase domain-containing protein [Lachnospiraceae bacterium]|nr:trypsin-like peptidase domain-containing protein [Lachnospiraceae bacterium]